MIKTPHTKILRIIEGFRRLVDNVCSYDPSSINEIIGDFNIFNEACDELRDELTAKKNSLDEVEELESKQKIIQHVDEMKPIIEKMMSLKAFW
jgi:ATP/maltotriose-dependent transcriptional regulator MalT